MPKKFQLRAKMEDGELYLSRTDLTRYFVEEKAKQNNPLAKDFITFLIEKLATMSINEI